VGRADGRFAAAGADLADTAFKAGRKPVFPDFFGIYGVPDDAPISGL
jgi:hypothetical protein